MGASLIALGMLILTTASIWRKMERIEYSGLSAALQKLPEKPTLLGLSFYQNSKYIRGFPFVHTVAYGQLQRGGRINSSFASVPFSPVVFRDTSQAWSAGLEMFPDRLRAGDLEHFTHVLVAAPAKIHRSICSEYGLVPMAPSGRWRLYSTRLTVSYESPRTIRTLVE